MGLDLSAPRQPRFSLRSAERLRTAALRLWHEPERLQRIVEDATALSKSELDSLYSEEDPLQLCAPGTVVWMGKPEHTEDEESEMKVLDTATLPVVLVDDPTRAFRDMRISSQMFSIHVPQNYFHRCSD